MRLFSRILLYFIGAVALLVLALDLSLKYFLPTQFVQEKITDLVAKYTNGEVKINSVSLGIMGASVGGISLLTPDGAEILTADNISIRLSPFKLIKGEIDLSNLQIENLQASIIKNADGKFNFEGLLVPSEEQPPQKEEPKEENSFLNTFKIKRFQIKNCAVNYKDIPAKTEASLKKLFFDVDNFTFIAPFRVSLNANASYEGGGISVKNIPFGFTLFVDLKTLDLPQAMANIRMFVVERGETIFNLSGSVTNFQTPQADLTIKLSRLSQATLEGIAEAEGVSIDTINLLLQAAYDISAQNLTLKNANLSISGINKENDISIDSVKLLLQAVYDIAGQKLTVNNADFSAAAINKEGEISVDNIKVLLQAAYDIAGQKLTVKNADISALDSTLKANGWVVLGKTLDYEANVELSAVLDTISKAFKILQEYKLTGLITSSVNVKKDDIKGTLGTKDVGVYYAEAGAFSKLNSSIEAKSIKHISLNSLTGYLDGNLFKAAANYKADKDKGDFNFNFNADKLILNRAQKVAEPSQPIEEPILADKPEISPEVAKVWVLPPLNIQGAVLIGQLQTPFLNTGDLDFEIDIKSFTPDLSKIGGRLSLDTQNGRIKDLYKLTNANAITKVLFVSLGVVSKVINSLDVLALLNTLSAAVLPSDKQEEVLQTAPEKIESSLDYDRFNIALSFKDGLTDIEKGYFVSSLLSFNIDGDINFATRDIAMFVNAAPGRHKTDGIMPLKLNVGGTLDNPQGSMSMLSSAANIISQSVFNNAGSRLVKDKVGGILGFFGIGSKSKKAKKAAADKAAENEFIPLELPEDPSELTEESVETEPS